MGTTYRRIKAVTTTLVILEALAESREPITGSEIAGMTQVPFATVMCHMATLQDRGYVQVIGEKYRLGMKLAVFWARMKSMKEAERQAVDKDLRILDGDN